MEQQCDMAAKMIAASGSSARPVSGSDEESLWNEHARLGLPDRGALLKVSVLPTDLAETLGLIERLAGSEGYVAAGRAGSSVFLLRVLGEVPLQKRVIEGLRGALLPGRGSAVLVQGSPELKTQVDVWGTIGDGLSLMRAVKQQFDPGGVLNPGRGPGGI